MEQKSEVVQKLDHVQKELLTLVKPLGFRRRGRTFSRSFEDDIQQVIGLQAGQFEIGRPLPPEVAHLRPNLYGLFTINLGVFVPEIYARSSPGFAPRGVVTDAHCGIRARFGHLAPHQRSWLSLKDDPKTLLEEIGSFLIEIGIPFLDRFSSREAIIREWVEFNDNEVRLTQVARLDTAMILLRHGKVCEAKAMFEGHLTKRRESIPRNPGHEPYVRSLAAKLGLGELN